MASSPEHLLISSILRSKDIRTAISHNVTADMFDGYREEWEWLTGFWKKHRRIPTERTFTLKYTDFQVEAVEDVGHYSEEVRAMHARRQLSGVLTESAEKLVANDLDGAMQALRNRVVQVASSMDLIGERDVVSDYGRVIESIEEKHRRAEKHGFAGMPTGFPSLDDKSGGPQPGDLWVVGGRLGGGKTWTMLKIAAETVCAGNTVQYVSLEQPEDQVAMRFHALTGGLLGIPVPDMTKALRGQIEPRHYRRFARRIERQLVGSFYVADPSHGDIGPMQVEAQIERNRPDIVFIDYLTLMKWRGDMDWNGIGQLTKELKRIAMRYKVPIIAAVQLNRQQGLAKDMPGAEAIGQSDQIGQDADAVIILRRESDRVLKAKLAKYRHGPDGYTWFNEFDPLIGRYEEIGYERACELRDSDDMLKDD